MVHSSADNPSPPTRRRFISAASASEDHRLPPELPGDVIEEVLLRLPVGSILRFRCVCKSWRSRFSDPDFVKKQLKLSLARRDRQLDRSSLVWSERPSNLLMSCSLHSVLNGPFSCAAPLPFPEMGQGLGNTIVGSCNGLLCARFFGATKDFILVWNSCTGVFRQLPGNDVWPRFSDLAYGIGYDELSDDYKVVVVVLVLVGHVPIKAPARVFSLKKGSWTTVQFLDGVLFKDVSGVFVGGALYWIVKLPCVRCSTACSWDVVSFDLATDKFQVIPRFNFVYNVDAFPNLSVLRGSLCVTCYVLGVWSDVRMMKKEDGVASSWTLLAIIATPPPIFGPSESYWIPTPLYLFEDVLFLTGQFFTDSLILYSTKTNSVKHPTIYSSENQVRCQSTIYLESLVSPI